LLDAQMESLEFSEHYALLDERVSTIPMRGLEVGCKTIAV